MVIANSYEQTETISLFGKTVEVKVFDWNPWMQVFYMDDLRLDMDHKTGPAK